MSVQPVAALADTLPPYGNGTLPSGIRSRVVNNNNGLTVHMLEAGFESTGRPACCCCTASRSSPTAGAR